MRAHSFIRLQAIFAAICISVAAYAQNFTITPVPEEVAERMRGVSLPDGAQISLSELRLLTVSYFDFDGNIQTGQIVSNASVARDLLQIFHELYLARYQIASIRLIDDFGGSDDRSMEANNTSCFNYRLVPGTGKLSNHSMGVAIDINPVQNPFVTNRFTVPEEGKKYVDRSLKLPHMIDHDDLCFKLFKAHGFTWGGDWKNSKDYQHFEKKP